MFCFRSSNAQNMMRDNNSFLENTRNQQVLEVDSLNTVPIGHTSMPINKENENAEKGEPTMIFLPSKSTQEFDNLISQTKTGVALTGSAVMGKIGPTIGLIDIAESDETYFFRVALPGVSRDESKSQNLSVSL